MSKTTRAILRTTVLAGIGCGVVLFGYHRMREDINLQQIADLEAMTADLQARLARKEAMFDRIGRTRRMAHVVILSQMRGDEGEIAATTLRFIELDDSGAELDRREFTIPGSVLFLDTWTAKFGMEDVAIGHPMRGRTLVLLRRVYSDQVAPRDGELIDTPGGIPPGYASTEVAKFEQAVWQSFWQIASDPDLAERMGIRVAQGEVVYKPVRAGEQYDLIVDAVGGINLLAVKAGESTLMSRAGD